MTEQEQLSALSQKDAEIEALKAERKKVVDDMYCIEDPRPCCCEYANSDTLPIPDSGRSGILLVNMCVWCAHKKAESERDEAVKRAEKAEAALEKSQAEVARLKIERDESVDFGNDMKARAEVLEFAPTKDEAITRSLIKVYEASNELIDGDGWATGKTLDRLAAAIKEYEALAATEKK